MTETYVTDTQGGQTYCKSGFKTLLANVDLWKTEEQLGLPILRGRYMVIIQNLGVESGGKNTDSAHTLDYCVYTGTWADPSSGQYGTLLKFGNQAIVIHGNERIAFRSDTENGVCNIVQIEE